MKQTITETSSIAVGLHWLCALSLSDSACAKASELCLFCNKPSSIFTFCSRRPIHEYPL